MSNKMDSTDSSASGNGALVPAVSDRRVIPHEGYYPDYPPYGEAPEGTDWERVGRLLWQRKWWILATVVIGTMAGYGFSRYLSAEYEATAKLWIEELDARSGPIRSEGPLGGEGFVDVFRSRAVLQPVVEANRLHLRLVEPEEISSTLLANLDLGSEFVPGTYSLKVTGTSWTLSRDGLGTVERGRVGDPIGAAAGFRWNPPAPELTPGLEVRFHARTPEQAALGLRDALMVRFNSNSNIIVATLAWADPDQAAGILNDLSEQFLNTATDLRAQKIREEVEMLEEQTEFTEQRLERAELALETFRVQTIALPTEPTISSIPTGQSASRDPVFDAFFQRKVDAEQLATDLDQLETARTSLFAGTPPNPMALRTIPSAQTSIELSVAIDELNRLQLDRRTALSIYTEEHPTVRELTTQIQTLEQATLPSVLTDIIGQVRSQLGVLNEQIASQTSELRQIPSRTIELARRQREVTMAEQLHNMLLIRLKEAQLAEATSGPGIQILDPALVPTSPISNNVPRTILLFSMASFGMGVAGVLLHDRLDKRIRYPDQVTSGLGLPVLGVVPRLKSAIQANHPVAALAIESFRGLRTQIAHSNGASNGILLVTSPAPREGKSMVSANLAISYATAGHRTVLVDGDTRRGRAQEMFQLRRAPGLTDYLMGGATLEEVQQTTEVENLTLIARGHSRGFNADLLDSEQVDKLFERLREEFEVIVVDAPPLAAGADVLMLGQRSDKVVIVFRSGSTNQELARAKLEMLGNVELPIIGAVLNAMPKSAPYYDHYVHYYYADSEPIG